MSCGCKVYLTEYIRTCDPVTEGHLAGTAVAVAFCKTYLQLLRKFGCNLIADKLFPGDTGIPHWFDVHPAMEGIFILEEVGPKPGPKHIIMPIQPHNQMLLPHGIVEIIFVLDNVGPKTGQKDNVMPNSTPTNTGVSHEEMPDPPFLDAPPRNASQPPNNNQKAPHESPHTKWWAAVMLTLQNLKRFPD